MCGKNYVIFAFFLVLLGSPPRVREKPDTSKVQFGSDRITPACAGKTTQGGADFLDIRDHPRVCGKNDHTVDEFKYFVGSPPRVREKL